MQSGLPELILDVQVEPPTKLRFQRSLTKKRSTRLYPSDSPSQRNVTDYSLHQPRFGISRGHPHATVLSWALRDSRCEQLAPSPISAHRQCASAAPWHPPAPCSTDISLCFSCSKPCVSLFYPGRSPSDYQQTTLEIGGMTYQLSQGTVGLSAPLVIKVPSWLRGYCGGLILTLGSLSWFLSWRFSSRMD